MTDERKAAVASLKKEIAENKGSAYEFSIKGHPVEGCALFYNGKEVYTADKFHRVRDFVFDVFDRSPSVVGKWDFDGRKNAELSEKSETKIVFSKEDLRIDADNIKAIADRCKHETRFDFSPSEDDEETTASGKMYGMWRCECVSTSDIVSPIADMETEIVVPTLVSAFEKAGIGFGEKAKDLLDYMLVRRIPFAVTISRNGIDVSFSGF